MSSKSEEAYRILFEKAPVPYQSLDQSGKIIEVNDAWLRLLGYSREEVLDHNIAEFIIREQLPLLQSRFNQFKETGFIHGVEFEMIARDGNHVLVSVEGTIGRTSNGAFRQTHCILNDITETKRYEEELRQQKEEYETIFNSVPSLISYVDRNGVFIHCNKAVSENLGLPLHEIEGRSYHEILPKDAESLLRENDEVINTGKPKVNFVRPYHSISGKQGWLRVTKVPHYDKEGNITGVIALSEDITEQRVLEQQLNQRQKMEELGFLAGGVAHDFNNLLTVIMGFSELARDNAKGNVMLQKYLDNIIQATDRAANLTRQLLAFAHQQVIEPRVVCLNDLTMEMEKILRRLIGEKIELVSRYDPDLWDVTVDPGQYEQILLNLAVNARDAMEDGGKFTMETQNVRLDQSHSRLHPALLMGDYVMVSISDTGHGIPEDILPHIFKPFYSTKPKGKGTGLGLSTCYGIMKQSNGLIDVESEVGHGTTFRLYFPRSEETTNHAAIGVAENKKISGAETILLVEDEEMVSETAKLSLSAHGYRILCARDGKEALEIFHDRRDEIDLIISDVVMPRMGGRELLDGIREFDKKIPFLLASGYTDHLQIIEQIAEKGAFFIHKPYTPINLVHMVREVLDIANNNEP
jgi:PAS domain S-box-containing protein